MFTLAQQHGQSHSFSVRSQALYWNVRDFVFLFDNINRSPLLDLNAALVEKRYVKVNLHLQTVHSQLFLADESHQYARHWAETDSFRPIDLCSVPNNQITPKYALIETHVLKQLCRHVDILTSIATVYNCSLLQRKRARRQTTMVTI